MTTKVSHLRRAGYIRGNVRWPRGTHYFADDAFKALTQAQRKEIDDDPAITIEKAKKVPGDVTPIKELDLVDPKAAAKPSGQGSENKGGENKGGENKGGEKK